MPEPLAIEQQKSTVYRPGSFRKRWQPKKWKPVYEEMVLRSCMGMQNDDIARAYHYTNSHVAQILGSKQALIAKGIILDKLRKEVQSKIESRVLDLQDHAIRRIKEFLTDDNVYEKAPVQVADRSIEVLKGTGLFKSGGNNGNSGGINTQGGNVIVINSDDAKSLKDAITRSDEAKRLNSGEIEVEPTVTAAD